MKVRINIRWWSYLIVLLCILPPYGLSQVLIITKVTKFISICVSLGVIVILSRKHFEIQGNDTLFVIFLILQTFSCLENNSSMPFWFRFIISFFAIYIFTEKLINVNIYNTIKLIITYGIICIVVEGFLYVFEFIKYYSYVFLIYPLVAFGFIYLINIEKEKKYKVFFIILSIFTIVPVFLVNGVQDIEGSYIIEVLFFSILLMFPRLVNKFSPILGVGILCWLNIGILSLDVLSNNAFFKYILVDLFKKDLTVSGRSRLWQQSLHLIADKPLNGYGAGWIGIRAGDIFMNSHNQFLNIAVECGILGLIFFVIWLMSIFIKWDKDEFSKYLMWMIFPELAMFVGLAYSYIQLLSFFLLLFIIIQIIKFRKEKST